MSSLYETTGACSDNRKKWDACLGSDDSHDYTILQSSSARSDAAAGYKLDHADDEIMITAADEGDPPLRVFAMIKHTVSAVCQSDRTVNIDYSIYDLSFRDLPCRV